MGRIYVEKYFRQYDTCRQNEKPFCSHTCPFHMDVPDFQSKMIKSNYNAAYKTFRNAVGFPEIVASLCPEYCASVCPRKDLDQSVQLSLLEKTCVAKAVKKDPTDYNVPLKDRKIAVIGAGISGLACALRLSQKKYNVTVIEKSGRLGGKLWDMMPPKVFLEEIERQFRYEKYELQLNTEIVDMVEIRQGDFEAVYVATGKGGRHFGTLSRENRGCFLDRGIAVFAGGSLTGKDPVRAVADGLDMAWAIEVFLKTGKLDYPSEKGSCLAEADPDKLRKTEAVIPTDSGLFTDEEAAAEAARCIRCQCSACMKYCDVCAYHHKWPMRIRDDVMATVAFSTSPSMLKKTPAKRLMNTCTQCGLCDEVCPENIEIGGMLLEARRSLHKQGTLPGAFHQFWIRDMEFTNSGCAALAKKAPGQDRCSYAFFPGCQLGAADPRYVAEPYQWLLTKKADTGLILRCCSVPAQWAGNGELHDKEIANLRRDWEDLGRPVLILACPACGKHFAEHLPEIEILSLYEILDQWGFEALVHGGFEAAEHGKTALEQPGEQQEFSIFDPCTARHVEPLEQAVRNLAVKAGVSAEELPKGDLHGCCGYGGHGSEADAGFYNYVVKERSGLSENPYLVYCINCRDVFRGAGKQVRHILDLLFDIDCEGARLPDLTRRRQNRIALKEVLLREIWKEDMEKIPERCGFPLKIAPEMLDKMDRLKILEDDVCRVLELGEDSRRRTYNPEKDTHTCYRESGSITYWVEYRKDGEEYEVINVYTHRMKIKLEGMWNGRKAETDL